MTQPDLDCNRKNMNSCDNKAELVLRIALIPDP